MSTDAITSMRAELRRSDYELTAAVLAARYEHHRRWRCTAEAFAALELDALQALRFERSRAKGSLAERLAAYRARLAAAAARGAPEPARLPNSHGSK